MKTRLFVPYKKWRKTADEHESLKRQLALTQLYARKAIRRLSSMVNIDEMDEETGRIINVAEEHCRPT